MIYNILLVDDEAIERTALRLVIERNFGDRVRCFEVANGFDAIALTQQQKIDITIVDINMPEMDGVMTIEKMQKINSDIFYVIISAYSYFEYAQSSIRLGVTDYLTKPVRHTTLIETLQGIMHKKEELLRRRAVEESFKAKYEKIIPFIRQELFFKLISGVEIEENEDYYNEYLDINLSAAFCLAMKLDEKGVHRQGDFDYDIYRNTIFNFICEQLQNLTPNITYPMYGERLVSFIPAGTISNGYDGIAWSINLAECIRRKVLSQFNQDIYVGIGRIYNSLHKIYYSYIEAQTMLTQNVGVQHIRSYSDYYNQTEDVKDYPYSLENRISDAIIKGSNDETDALVDKLLDWLLNKYAHSINIYKLKVVEFISTIRKKVGQIDEEIIDRTPGMQDYITQIYEQNSIRSIHLWVKEYLKKVSGAMNNLQKVNYSKITEDAIEYINDNYKKDIRLEDIARQICVSQYYLSRLLRQQTGTGFTEYLNKKRIDEAINLIRHTNKSLKEISVEVGYNNYTYFSKVFKKITNTSPNEYK